MRTSRAIALLLLVLASAIASLGAPRSAHAQSGARMWAYCYLEGSGGVGTTIATIVLEPFEVDASYEKGLSEYAIAHEFDRTGKIGELIPGYKYFMSIGGTNCNVYKTRADAQVDVDAWRRSTKLVRVVDWKPSAEHTGLGGPGGKGKPGPSPAPAAGMDVAKLTQQARERIAKVATSPEILARNEDLARRRQAKRGGGGGSSAKPAPPKAAVAASPAAAKPGATLYWMCHYFNLAANTSYFSAISSAPQDNSVSSVQESLNYKKGWVAHLQKMGLNPGAGGTCMGMLVEKDIVGELASSKAHWIANRKSRIVDTGWMPQAIK